MPNPHTPELTQEMRDWITKDLGEGRRPSIQFVRGPDSTVAILMDNFAYAIFMMAADDKGVEVNRMLTDALLTTVGPIIYKIIHDDGPD